MHDFVLGVGLSIFGSGIAVAFPANGKNKKNKKIGRDHIAVAFPSNGKNKNRSPEILTSTLCLAVA